MFWQINLYCTFEEGESRWAAVFRAGVANKVTFLLPRGGKGAVPLGPGFLFSCFSVFFCYFVLFCYFPIGFQVKPSLSVSSDSDWLTEATSFRAAQTVSKMDLQQLL